MVSFAAYVALSTCLCVGHVAYVYATREQFYTTVQYLYTTNVSLTILGNFGLATVLLFGHLLKRFFFGTLRESEVERLYEQTWYAITETCLAITIFREELAVRFLVLLSVLLFVKTFHWLCEFRVEYIEQSPGVSRWTHVRVLSLLLVLLACDIGLAFSFLQRTLAEGPSVLLLFLFEFMILAVTNVSLIFKYLIILFDIARDNRWEQKSILLFYLEIASEMLQLTLYLVFFLIIFKYYGIPLHIVRDLYMTFMKLRKRIADFIRYRRVTANLNERFPNATDVELEEASHVCIICREPMTGGKKLPCAHVFHMQCLRSWLERQQTCPICRAPVLEEEFTPEQRERARRREESLQAAARNRDQRDGAHSSDNPAARAESETPQNNAGPSHADTHTSEPAAMRVAGEAPLAAAGHGAAGGAVTSAASSSQASHLPVPSHDLALPPLGALDPEDQARVLQFHADMLQNYVSYYESLARDLQLRAAKKATTEVASGSEAPEAAARETRSAAVPASAESAEATPETRSAPAPHTAAAPASADSADAVVLDRSDSPRTQAELRRRRLEALEGRHRAAHAAPDDREGEADGARRSD